MFRSFIPFILASLGLTMISWAGRTPLFEWQLSQINTDFSSSCEGNLPSHWTTRFGESLEVRSSLLGNLNLVVRRSWTDETLDRLSLGLYDSSQWLFVGTILSMIYMWWFLLQDKQGRASHIVAVVFFTIIAVFMYFLLSQVVMVAGPAIGRLPYYFGIRDCHGTLTFTARLSKINCETLIVLFAGILLELGAIGVMVRQIAKVVRERKGL